VDHNEKHGDAKKFAELSPEEFKGMNDEWAKYLARIYNSKNFNCFKYAESHYWH
jgi:hypothetical protein